MQRTRWNLDAKHERIVTWEKTPINIESNIVTKKKQQLNMQAQPKEPSHPIKPRPHHRLSLTNAKGSLEENLSIITIHCISWRENTWILHFDCQPKVFRCGWRPNLQYILWYFHCELQWASCNRWLSWTSSLLASATENVAWPLSNFICATLASNLAKHLTNITSVIKFNSSFHGSLRIELETEGHLCNS